MTANEITTLAAQYLAASDSPGKAAWCREGIVILAEWMGLEDMYIQNTRCGYAMVRNGNRGVFDPFRSLDDLQPVLRRIAEPERNMWSAFRHNLVVIDACNALPRKDLSRLCLLSCPLVLAAAAWATIAGEG